MWVRGATGILQKGRRKFPGYFSNFIARINTWNCVNRCHGLYSLAVGIRVGMIASFIAMVVLFLLLCGWLVKERRRAERLEDRIHRQENSELANGAGGCGNRALEGLLIVSSDLRIRFANERYFRTTFQGPEDVLGREIQDVILTEGVEERAMSLFARSDPATSSCMNAFIRVGLGGKRPVHVTMAWIAPQEGEDCVVVVLEDLLQGSDLAAGRYKC